MTNVCGSREEIVRAPVIATNSCTAQLNAVLQLQLPHITVVDTHRLSLDI